MNGPNVSLAFANLIEALTQERYRAADSIREATIQGNLAEAQQILIQAQRIERFLSAVQQLKKAWESAELPGPALEIRRAVSPYPSAPPPRAATEDAPELTVLNRVFGGTTARRYRGWKEPVDRTPEKAYHIPILEALEQLGGRGYVHQVLDIVYERMKDRLTEDDLKPLPSGRGLRWRNTAMWARVILVQNGLLKQDSPKGIWELSQAGWDYLHEIRREREGEE
jgi:hypothetical protein